MATEDILNNNVSLEGDIDLGGGNNEEVATAQAVGSPGAFRVGRQHWPHSQRVFLCGLSFGGRAPSRSAGQLKE